MKIRSFLHAITARFSVSNFQRADVQSTQEETHADFPRILAWVFIVLVALKMALVANEEIIAYNLPHDDLWQIRAAGRAYWGGNYGDKTLLHLPIYPWFVGLVSLVGLPLRIATDLVFCASACFFSFSIWRLGCGRLATLLVAAVLMLNPASFQLPNRAGAEVLLAPVLMAALGASLLWWSSRTFPSSRRFAIAAAVGWALAWNLRKESILLAGLLGIFAVCIVIADRSSGARKVDARLAWGVGFPLAASVLVSMGIKTGNYLRWGAFTDSIITSPGYTAAYKALQSIPPASPLDFIPVPMDVRERAYEASASFAELRPYLEGRVGRGWAKISREAFLEPMGLPQVGEGEIAAGWFYWALHDSAVAAGYANAREENRFFLRVAQEIKSAQAAGKLGKRWVPVAMIDPDWDRWLPRLPASFGRVAMMLVNPAVTDRPMRDATENPDIVKRFNRIANRRGHSLQIPQGMLGGWAIHPDTAINALTIVSASNTVLARATPTTIRTDIDSTRPTGFNLSTAFPVGADWETSRLVIELSNHETVTFHLSALQAGRVVSAPSDRGTVSLGLDVVSKPVPVSSWTWEVQARLESFYLQAEKMLTWVIALIPCAFLWSVFQRRALPPTTIVLVLLGSAVASRLLFFSILDASSWPGNQPRYLYPITPLYAVFLTLTAIHLYATFRAPRKPAATPPNSS